MTAAIEQMKQESYAAGWKAAIEAMSAVIANLPAPEGDSSISAGSYSTSTSGGKAPDHATPTVGTTPYYVFQAVQQRQGMTGAEVVAAVRAAGHDVAEPQIRTALSRLERRQLLANRHRKWFLK